MQKFVSYKDFYLLQHADILDGDTTAYLDFSILFEKSDIFYRYKIILLKEESIAITNYYTASGYNTILH